MGIAVWTEEHVTGWGGTCEDMAPGGSLPHPAMASVKGSTAQGGSLPRPRTTPALTPARPKTLEPPLPPNNDLEPIPKSKTQILTRTRAADGMLRPRPICSPHPSRQREERRPTETFNTLLPGHHRQPTKPRRCLVRHAVTDARPRSRTRGSPRISVQARRNELFRRGEASNTTPRHRAVLRTSGRERAQPGTKPTNHTRRRALQTAESLSVHVQRIRVPWTMDSPQTKRSTSISKHHRPKAALTQDLTNPRDAPRPTAVSHRSTNHRPPSRTRRDRYIYPPVRKEAERNPLTKKCANQNPAIRRVHRIRETLPIPPSFALPSPFSFPLPSHTPSTGSEPPPIQQTSQAPLIHPLPTKISPQTPQPLQQQKNQPLRKRRKQ